MASKESLITYNLCGLCGEISGEVGGEINGNHRRITYTEQRRIEKSLCLCGYNILTSFDRAKIIIILLLIIFIFPFISGCNDNRVRNDNGTAKKHLEFWTISLKPTYNDYINGLIAEYEKKHPKISIEWVDVPINIVMQKLMAAIAGGVPPDVVNLNSGYAQILSQNRALVSIDDAVPPEKQALYFKNLWNAACFENENYAIPWYVTTRVVIYNKKIFKAAGLDPEKPPKTWEEVGKYAETIKKNTGHYGYIPAIKLLEDWKIRGVPILSDDRKKALFNCPEGVRVLAWYVNLYKRGMPKETLTEGYQGALNRYQGGNLGMLIAGSTLLMKIESNAPEVYKNTGVAPMPLGKAKIIPAATMNLVVPRSSKYRKEAVDFALYVTNNENQLKFCKLVPLLPSTKKAAQDEYFQKGKGEALQDEAIRISIKQLYYAKDLSLGLKHSQKLNRAINEALESAFYGRKTPGEALDEAANKWDKILNTP